MATSGDKQLILTAGQIARDALRKSGVYAIHDSIPAEEFNNTLRDLNLLIIEQQASGFHIWNDRRATLFLQYGQAKYLLGSTGDNATEDYNSTTLSSNATAPTSTIQVSSIENISDGDYIGIIKNDNYIFWTTVNGAPSGSTVTLTDDLDGDANSGNTVYTYTTKITKPIEITEVLVKRADNNEVGLLKMSRQEYFEMSNKNSTGIPTQYYYHNTIDNGTIYLWPTSTNANNVINFTYQPYLDIFKEESNTPDLPPLWYNALVWKLAYDLCSSYGKSIEAITRIKMRAEESLMLARNSDNENCKLIFKDNYDSKYN
jgi:hypothetical protein